MTATVFPFLVPSNFFAVVSLRQAAEMLEHIRHDRETAADCRALADEVEKALRLYAVVDACEIWQDLRLRSRWVWQFLLH